MTKNLEQLIEETVIPDMECSPKRASVKPNRVSVTVDEIPEVELPKTKAEVYREAKGRLSQKTRAATKPSKRVKTKTVELEIAAVTEAAEKAESEQIKYRKHTLKNPDVTPVWVGSPDELVPFAWRNPLVADIARPSKYYRNAVREAKALMLPVPNNK